MDYKKYLHYLEVIVDKSIPYFLLLLIAIIVIEFFFKDTAATYAQTIELVDGIILLAFVVDLLFKYRRAATFKEFLKKYWLEIIAIIPFYLVFRLFEGAIIYVQTLREGSAEAQKLVHVGLELEKQGALIRAAEGETKLAENIGRAERLDRFVKPLLRSAKVTEAAQYYENPRHRKELQKETKEWVPASNNIKKKHINKKKRK
ncbi:hypothetical protein HZB00_01260 [Candidatus Woesearchaeota archaeon]|nr:hypothetical protein [Candidatus Woesearchaeota archaeon]